MSVDNQKTLQTLKVSLKRSKTDQFGRGVDVFVGSTGDGLCPGPERGCFDKFSDGKPLTKAKFTQHVRMALEAAGLPCNQDTVLGLVPPQQQPKQALRTLLFT